MDFQVKAWNLFFQVLRTYVGCVSYIGIGRECPFLVQQSVGLQTAQLRDGVVQFSGVLLDIHGVLLRFLIGSRKIPGGFFIYFDNGVVYVSKFALLVGVVFGQSLRCVRGKIIVVYCI